MEIWTSFGYQSWLKPNITQPTDNKQMMSVNPSSKTEPSVIPQKQMMSYNVKVKNPSSKYVWLEKEEGDYIDSKINEIWVSWADKKLLEESAYKTMIQAKQSKAFLEDREQMRQKLLSGEIKVWDDNIKNKIYKTSQFADIIRQTALESWVKNVNQTNDDTIIKSTLSQRPDLQESYNKFLLGEISPIEMSSKITWKRVPSWLENVMNSISNSSLWDWIREKTTNIVWEENMQKYQEANKNKSFEDIAFNDMWAVPSVIAGAISVPIKAWATLIDLWGKAFWKDIKANESIDKFIENTPIQKDWWFDAGKIATEIWLSAMWVNTLMWQIGNVWQLANVINKYPKIIKYIAKPILEGIGYQWTSDLVRWKLSDKKSYLTSAALSLWANALGWIMWAAQKKIAWIEPSLKNAVKQMDNKTFTKIVNEAKSLNKNMSSRNPLLNSVDEIDKVAKTISDQSSSVGKEIWTIRKQLDEIPLNISRQSIFDKFNTTLSDIANTRIIKSWKSYKFTNSWPWVSTISVSAPDKTLIKNALSLVEQSQKGMRVLSIETLDKALRQLSESSTATNTTKKALVDFSKSLMKDVDNQIPETLRQAKTKYSDLMKIKEWIEKISSEWWSKWLSILKQLNSPSAWQEVKDILLKAKELWLTDKNILEQIYATNHIMANILSKWQLQQALEQIYPSVPWVIEAAGKWIKSIVAPKIKTLGKYTKSATKTMQSWIKQSAIEKSLTNKNEK